MGGYFEGSFSPNLLTIKHYRFKDIGRSVKKCEMGDNNYFVSLYAPICV